MRTRTLNSFEAAVIKKHLANESAAFVKTRGRTTKLIYTHEQMQRAISAENAEQTEKAKSEMAADAEYFKSDAFKQDVIEAIMDDGATREQAIGRTRDQLRLFQEARNYNLI